MKKEKKKEKMFLKNIQIPKDIYMYSAHRKGQYEAAETRVFRSSRIVFCVTK